MTIIWCMVPGIWSVTEFFVILDRFLPFCPPNNPKSQSFEEEKKKKKKKSGDIIILDMCMINANHMMHMMYGSWDMKCDRQKFLSFWTVFCHFTAVTTGKIKILKNWKKCLKILSSFYTCMAIKWCMVPEILSAIHRFFCHFGLFFVILPP